MKKQLLVTGLLVLSLGSSLAFAAENTQQHQQTMPMGQMVNAEQMKDFHKQMLEQAVKDGRMTAEQAKVMEEHMTSMQGMMGNMGAGMMGQMGAGMMGANGSGGCCANKTQPEGAKQ